MKRTYILTMVVIFVGLSAALYLLNKYIPAYKFIVLMAGNLTMLVLAITTYLIVVKQLDRPAAFVRSISASSFIKLMVCMIGMLAYVLMNRAGVHKPSVLMLFGIYAVYTVAETLLLSKIARRTN